MEEVDLLTIFNTVIRPTLEYAVPTYHPMMLKQEMAEDFEQIQKRASKIIFGWNSHYKDIIAAGKMEKLSDRREKMTLNFAKKAAESERFSSWFPKKQYNVDLHVEKVYEEQFARTERLRKSPDFHNEKNA